MSDGSLKKTGRDDDSHAARRIIAKVPMTILPLCDKDVDDIAFLDKLLFGSSWSRDSFRAELENNVSANYIVRAETDIIAYAITWTIIDELQINKIAVIPQYRNLGIASWLLEYILLRAAQAKINRAFIEVRRSNASAIHLYTKFGFEPYGVRRNYYDSPKEDALLMKKIFMEK